MDGNGDLLADFHNIFNKRKNYFSQLLNEHSVNDVSQVQLHTAQPLASGSSPLEVEITIAKLIKHKLQGYDQIPAELSQVGSETLLSVIHKLINSIWNWEELPDQWKSLLLYQLT
jgi:hypothetical protein